MEKIREIISHLIYVRNWKWLEYVIGSICELECKLKPENQIRHNLFWFDNTDLIPEGIYCYDGRYTCPFLTRSRIAELLYGSQCCGYCSFMQKGDFSVKEPTDLLWDFCKCCSVKLDEEIDEDNTLECNLEL